MGQKVNPIGLRLGIHRKWDSSWAFDFKNYSKLIYINFNIEKFFKGFLHYYPKKILLVKCQIVKLASNKLYIFVFFYKLRVKKVKKLKKWNKKKPQVLNYPIPTPQLVLDNQRTLSENFIKQNFNNNNILKLINHKLKIQKDKDILIIKKYYFNELLNLTNFVKKISILKVKNDNKYKILFYKYYVNFFIKKLILFNQLKILKNSYNLFILNNKKDNSLLYKIQLNNKKINHFLQLSNNYKNILNYNSIQHILNKKIFILNQSYYLILFYNKLNLKKKEFINFRKFVHLKKFKNVNNDVKLWKVKQKQYFFKDQNIYKYRLLQRSANFHKKFKKIKKFISSFTNSKVSIVFINTLSFSKFYYNLKQENEKLKKNFNTINTIEKRMVSKYRYDAIYINDLINITFISFLVKNPQFLVNFLAFQFKNLPINKKQLKLIQLITQVIKIFAADREEVIGFKLQFKGRINKKKRARTLTVNQGIIALQSTITRVEYGTADAYTKSGIIGIKLWIFYKKSFKNQLKKSFLQYLEYSKLKQNILKMKLNKEETLKNLDKVFLNKTTLKLNVKT